MNPPHNLVLYRGHWLRDPRFARSPRSPRSGGRDVEAILEEIDTNKDGKLSLHLGSERKLSGPIRTVLSNKSDARHQARQGLQLAFRQFGG